MLCFTVFTTFTTVQYSCQRQAPKTTRFITDNLWESDDKFIIQMRQLTLYSTAAVTHIARTSYNSVGGVRRS